MTRRFHTRWAVVAFVVIGVIVAMWLIIRGLGGGPDETGEEGTVPSLVVLR